MNNTPSQFDDSNAFEELKRVISRVGDSATEAGVSFSELIALITAAQESTARGGAVLGNSLKTIFMRLNHPNTVAALGALGISLGKTRLGTLLNIVGNYDSLPPAGQSLVTELVGGIYQISVIKAIVRHLT